MEGEKKIVASIEVEANPDMRRGAYSNFVSLRRNGSNCIMDFCFLDGEVEGRGMTGVLASRVIMSNDRLIELRDALDRQILGNADAAEAEHEL